MVSPSSDSPTHAPVFILLGPAGGGRSTVLGYFRECGFTTVDDLAPTQLNTTLSALTQVEGSQKAHPPLAIALTLTPNPDVPTDNGAALCKQLQEDLLQWKSAHPELKVLWLEAPRTNLVHRCLHTGQDHPFQTMVSQGSLEEAVELNHQWVSALKPLHDLSMDTASLPLNEIRAKVAKLAKTKLPPRAPFTVHCMSFAYKNGVPQGADLVLDARFLTNPFYVDELRPMNGTNAPVQEYIHSFNETQSFLTHWTSMLDLVIPLYENQGKSRLTVAFGCTGGKHRSVCLAEDTAAHIREHFPQYRVITRHREQDDWPSTPLSPAQSKSSRPSACPQS